VLEREPCPRALFRTCATFQNAPPSPAVHCLRLVIGSPGNPIFTRFVPACCWLRRWAREGERVLPSRIALPIESCCAQHLCALLPDPLQQVFHPRTASCLYTLPSAGEALPITALRWRGGGSTKTKNVLIAASADGSIRHWHVSFEAALGSIEPSYLNATELWSSRAAAASPSR